MSYQSKSWVWQYGKRQGDRAFCGLCDDSSNKEFSCAGGSTGSFGRHLKVIHNVGRTIQNERYAIRFYYYFVLLVPINF